MNSIHTHAKSFSDLGGVWRINGAYSVHTLRHHRVERRILCGDIHNIFQWGNTDRALRTTMRYLGYEEAYYANYGWFSDLSAFENHAFVFVRAGLKGVQV